MRKKRIVITIILLLAITTACSDSSVDKDTSNNQISDNTTKNEEHAQQPAEENEIVETESIELKETYRDKWNAMKKEMEALEPKDSSTYALKEVENIRWENWDQLLNEIYGVLQEQLAVDEMETLREQQREWIEYRDNQALEASLEYKGGTQEHLEYVAVLARITMERCEELIENYL